MANPLRKFALVWTLLSCISTGRTKPTDCLFYAARDSQTSYIQKVHKQDVVRMCPPGTAFVQEDCGCTRIVPVIKQAYQAPDGPKPYEASIPYREPAEPKPYEASIPYRKPDVPKPYREPAVPKPYREPAVPKPYEASRPYRKPDVPKPYRKPAVPKPYREPAVPKPYREPDVPKPYQEPDVPVPYQSPDVPNPYQLADRPMPYQAPTIQKPYQTNDGPKRYRTQDGPIPYQTQEIPKPYQRSDTPKSYRTDGLYQVTDPQNLNLGTISQQQKAGCSLYAVKGSITKYIQRVHNNDVVRPCSPGTAFVQKDCGCTATIPVTKQMYQRPDVSTPYQGLDVQKPYQEPDVTKPYPGQNVPKPYQEPDVPKPYQEPDVPKPYQEPDVPKPYQEPAVPKPYQESDIPKAYGKPDVSNTYQLNDGPKSYQAPNIPKPYERKDTPISYQLADRPKPYQTQDEAYKVVGPSNPPNQPNSIDACPLYANRVSTTSYIEIVHSKEVVRDCPPGTAFVQEDCGCSASTASVKIPVVKQTYQTPDPTTPYQAPDPATPYQAPDTATLYRAPDAPHEPKGSRPYQQPGPYPVPNRPFSRDPYHPKDTDACPLYANRVSTTSYIEIVHSKEVVRDCPPGTAFVREDCGCSASTASVKIPVVKQTYQAPDPATPYQAPDPATPYQAPDTATLYRAPDAPHEPKDSRPYQQPGPYPVPNRPFSRDPYHPKDTDACPLYANRVSTTSYIEIVHSKEVVRDCPPGTAFVQEDCGCSASTASVKIPVVKQTYQAPDPATPYQAPDTATLYQAPDAPHEPKGSRPYQQPGPYPVPNRPFSRDPYHPKDTVCRLYAVPQSPEMYSETVFDRSVMKYCERGTVFVQEKCGCTVLREMNEGYPMSEPKAAGPLYNPKGRSKQGDPSPSVYTPTKEENKYPSEPYPSPNAYPPPKADNKYTIKNVYPGPNIYPGVKKVNKTPPEPYPSPNVYAPTKEENKYPSELYPSPKIYPGVKEKNKNPVEPYPSANVYPPPNETNKYQRGETYPDPPNVYGIYEPPKVANPLPTNEPKSNLYPPSPSVYPPAQKGNTYPTDDTYQYPPSKPANEYPNPPVVPKPYDPEGGRRTPNLLPETYAPNPRAQSSGKSVEIHTFTTVSPKYCQGVKLTNGKGYTSYQGSCRIYIKCQEVDYKLVAEKSLCPNSLFWSDNDQTCVQPKKTDCHWDPCRSASASMTLPVQGYCGAYHVCENYKTLSIESCPSGQRYEEGYGSYRPGMAPCVIDPKCQETPPQFKKPVVCRRYPVDGSPDKYKEDVFKQKYIRSCAPGTAFVEKDCACTAMHTIKYSGTKGDSCRPELKITFVKEVKDTSGKGVSIGTSGKKVKLVPLAGSVDGYAGEFHNSQLILWRFNSVVIASPLVVQFGFKEKDNFKTSRSVDEILVTDGGYTIPPSLRISLDRYAKTVKASIRSSSGKYNKPITLIVPYEEQVLKKVSLVYDGKYVSLRVNSKSLSKSESAPVEGDIKIVGDLLIGGAKDSVYFSGIMDDISIFFCLPKEFAPKRLDSKQGKKLETYVPVDKQSNRYNPLVPETKQNEKYPKRLDNQKRGNDYKPYVPTQKQGNIVEPYLPTQKQGNIVDPYVPTQKQMNNFEYLPTHKQGNIVEPYVPTQKQGNGFERYVPTQKQRNNFEYLPTQKQGNIVEPFVPTQKQGNGFEPYVPTQKQRNNFEYLPTQKQGNIVEPYDPTQKHGNYYEPYRPNLKQGSDYKPIVPRPKQGNGNEPYAPNLRLNSDKSYVQTKKQGDHYEQYAYTEIQGFEYDPIPNTDNRQVESTMAEKPVDEHGNTYQAYAPIEQQRYNNEAHTPVGKQGNDYEAHTPVGKQRNDNEAYTPVGKPGNDYEAYTPVGKPGNDYEAHTPVGKPGNDYEAYTPVGKQRNDYEAYTPVENPGNNYQADAPDGYQAEKYGLDKNEGNPELFVPAGKQMPGERQNNKYENYVQIPDKGIESPAELSGSYKPSEKQISPFDPNMPSGKDGKAHDPRGAHGKQEAYNPKFENVRRKSEFQLHPTRDNKIEPYSLFEQKGNEKEQYLPQEKSGNQYEHYIPKESNYEQNQPTPKESRPQELDIPNIQPTWQLGPYVSNDYEQIAGNRQEKDIAFPYPVDRNQKNTGLRTASDHSVNGPGYQDNRDLYTGQYNGYPSYYIHADQLPYYRPTYYNPESYYYDPRSSQDSNYQTQNYWN